MDLEEIASVIIVNFFLYSYSNNIPFFLIQLFTQYHYPSL